METITFLSLLEDCADRCGLLTPEGTVPAVHAAFLARRIQQQLRKGWRWFAWPDLTLTEQRAYRPVWSASATYASGDEVFFETDETYYEANATTTAGQSPATHPAKWDELTELPKYVALRQTGLAVIGEVLGVTTRDPEISREAGTVSYRFSDFGLTLGVDAPARVWVQFRKPAPKFTAVEWEAGTFAAGTLRYHDGECWEALVSTTAEPGTDATKWEEQEIPEFLHDFAVEAVYADWLDDDGQKAKATAQRDDAEDLLADERNQFTRQQGQQQRYAVRTR